jgi:restriction system protein
MTPGEKQTLLETLDELEPGRTPLDGQAAERRMFAVLEPLLAADGYAPRLLGPHVDRGADIIAERPASEHHEAQRLVVELKYRRQSRPLMLDAFARFVVAAMREGAARAMVVTNTGFSPRVREQIRQRLPYEMELLDLTDLRAWISRLRSEEQDLDAEARLIVQDLARRFANMIACNPRILDRIEWRDLERIVAEIFGGLGFEVELTPPAKDGGKDVILQCHVRGTLRSYIVEVKHWRSATRVGGSSLREFVDVVAREARDGGVFLSTYGYTDNAFEALTEIERQRVRFGREEKIAALCRKYTRAASGLWSPPEILADIVFEDTE